MPLFLNVTSPSSLTLSEDPAPRRAASSDQAAGVAPSVAQQPRILIQVESGPTGVALDPGLPHLAASLSAEVTLLLVVRPPSSHAIEWLSASRLARSDVMPAVDLLERQARRQLQRLARAFPGLRVETEVLVGDDPDREIARWLRNEDYDLVVQPRPRTFRLPRPVATLFGGWPERSQAAALTG